MKEPALIPDVAELKRFNGEFSLTPASFIAAAPGTEAAAELLREYLSIPTGFDEIAVVPEPAAGCGGIHLRVAGEPEPDRVGLCDESYRLAVRTDAVEISAANRFGLLRAIQTLRQLLPPEIYAAGKTGLPAWSIPCLQLEDAPEFRWRGMHFDVARHFFTVPEVCRYIELLAQHKFNVLHWHLTDDQGWRVEIKSYPRLTRIGAFRKRSQDINPERTPVFDNVAHGGFYTQDDIAEIVGFAARRGITVVPEIDMPGHIQSAIAAYPELGNNPAVNPGVMEAWGFRYSTTAFVWIKLNPRAGTVFWGPGNWTHANAELCLLATKGHPKRQARNIHQLIISNREEHSKKPEEARRRIEALMGNLPRVELFARRPAPGWDVWGNEVDCTADWPAMEGKT